MRTKIWEFFSTSWGIASVIALIVLLRLFFPGDDRCYIDWDGRSNPTVCD